MRGARRGHCLFVALCILLLAFAPGCSRRGIVGVSHESGELRFYIPLCNEVRLTGIRVEDLTGLDSLDSGPTLWRATGEGDVQLVNYGPAPAGFDSETVVPLPELLRDYQDRTLRVITSTTGSTESSISAFTLAEVPQDGDVLFDDDSTSVPVGRVSKDLQDQCVDPFERFLTVAEIGAVGLVVVAVLTLIGVRRWRSAPRCHGHSNIIVRDDAIAQMPVDTAACHRSGDTGDPPSAGRWWRGRGWGDEPSACDRDWVSLGCLGEEGGPTIGLGTLGAGAGTWAWYGWDIG